MRFGSVCSGIEAASVAWHPLGWRAAWFSEIDKGACEVLAYRFPDVANHGDMLRLAAKVRAREIEAPGILVGGTPCQSFSVAGMRKGLDDPRGQLTIAFIDLANAIDEIRRMDGLPPCIIVWENVPGVLTHKDNPFGCFLAGLAGEGDALIPPGRKWTNAGCVLGPERTAAWRVQDAQFHGLPQRRRRVFVVASAREGFDPAAILLEFDGLRRDSPPSREAGEGATHPVAPCLTSSGRGVERTGDPRGQDPVVAVTTGRDDGDGCGGQPDPEGVRGGRVREPAGVTGTLCSSGKAAGSATQQDAETGMLIPVAFGGNNQSGPIDVATACNAHGGPHGRLEFESETFIVEPSPICFSSKDYGADAQDDLSPTLRAGGHAESHANAGVPPAVVYSVALRGREGGATAELGDDVAGCLRASTGGGDKPHVLVAFPAEMSGTQCAAEGDLSPALSVKHTTAVCVTGSVTHTLKAEGFDASEDGTGRGQPIVNVQMAVRRLMPVECERLQGFPDNWTLVPTGKKGKPAADGPRYKQLGNSMATTVMYWIGRRIQRQIGHNGGPPLDDFEALLG